jgi:hypothetical protein
MGELINNPLFSDASLKAYYRMEGNANDEKGVHNASSSLNATFGEAYGRFGQGVSYASGWSVIPDHADFRPTSNFSVGIWCKTTTTSNSGLFVAHYRDGSGQQAGWKLWIAANGKALGIMGATGARDGDEYNNAKMPIVTSANAINDGLLHLMIMTYDGSSQKIYIDDKAVVSNATSISVGYGATNPVRIGSDYYDGNPINSFAGSLDDAFFFNGKILTAEEVLSIYASGHSKIYNFV